jgi:hypothetical protein
MAAVCAQLGERRESRVCRAVAGECARRRTEYCGVDTCKVRERVVEGKNLSWADKGEVPWGGKILARPCVGRNFE